MSNNKVQEEFKDLIKEVVDKQIESYMKNNNIYRFLTGEVVRISTDYQHYSIDIGDTIVPDVLNKSNLNISRGDTVTFVEKVGSNFCNCFILCKNGFSQPIEEKTKYHIFNIDYVNNAISIAVSGVTDYFYKAILSGENTTIYREAYEE